MTTVVLSPHTDDAVFSIGAHLNLRGALVVSPMAGVPRDVEGSRKHTTLREEHRKAMSIIGCTAINGPFLDDVYPAADRDVIRQWMRIQLRTATQVYVPLGIHHPDHMLVSNTAIGLLLGEYVPVRFYEELPYRVLYPGIVKERLAFISSLFGELKLIEDTNGYSEAKERAVKAYASQTDDDLIEKLQVGERIWEQA
jgi:LmbE family N-acetylglucosaminyl deacetylase